MTKVQFYSRKYNHIEMTFLFLLKLRNRGKNEDKIVILNKITLSL